MRSTVCGPGRRNQDSNPNDVKARGRGSEAWDRAVGCNLSFEGAKKPPPALEPNFSAAFTVEEPKSVPLDPSLPALVFGIERPGFNDLEAWGLASCRKM